MIVVTNGAVINSEELRVERFPNGYGKLYTHDAEHSLNKKGEFAKDGVEYRVDWEEKKLYARTWIFVGDLKD